MSLSSHQLDIIRESTKDEASCQRIIDLIEDLQTKDEPTPTTEDLSLSVDDSQLQLLKAVVESIPMPTFIKDNESRFVMANQMTVELVGLDTFDNLKGKTDFDLYPEDVASYHFNEEQEILETGIPMVEKELTSVRDGDQDWHRSTKAPIFDQSGNIIGLIGINRDITEEKQVQIQQSEERNLLRTIIDNVNDRVYVKDRQSRFILGNRMTLEAHQCTHEELIGTTDFDYIQLERAQRYYQEEQDLMKFGKSIINLEHKLSGQFTADGMPRWFLVSKLPLKDDNDDVYGFVGINHDITSVKIAEKQRLELELERERIKILNEFITNSSHEFRTPISTIQTAAYLMRNAETFEQVHIYVDRIEAQVKRITELLESLHIMSRLDKNPELSKRSIRLTSILKTLFSQMRNSFEQRHIDAKLDIDESADIIYGDSGLLSIAIKAILENAIRYTPQHGIVTLHSYVEDDIPIIAVSDTGIGMSDRVISRIFQRFYRADEAHSTKGFGLGLSIANRVVELHNGYIEVSSEQYIGSTFRIILPQPEMFSNENI